MALIEIDRVLIDHCLTRQPGAWKMFVDRFSGLFVHVVKQTAGCRSFSLQDADLDDITAEIMSSIVANDFQVLRVFRGNSSLATYLAVIARRVAVKQMVAKRKSASAETVSEVKIINNHLDLENRDQLEYLIRSLSDNEARIVQAFHLEGKTYREISKEFSITENSIGPVLNRAKEYMRRVASPQ